MTFDEVWRAATSWGIAVVTGGEWTALGDTGYQLRSDLTAPTEWAVAAGWPTPDRTAVAARLLVPCDDDGGQQYATPLVLLDADPKAGSVVAHYVTRHRDGTDRGAVNHVMIRTSPKETP